MSGLGLGPVTLGSSSVSNPGMQNPLMALITALGQVPQQMEQQKFAKQQLDVNALGMQVQKQDMDLRQRQLDDQDWATMTQAVIRNPSFGSDPTFKARMQKLSQSTGIPLQLDASGNIVRDQFLKDPSEVDPKIMMQIASLPPGAPRENAAMLQGVRLTPEEITRDAAVLPKDAASIAHWKSEGLHWAVDDKIRYNRSQFQNEYDTARSAQDWARIGDMQTRTAIAQQNANAHMITANASALRAQTDAKRLLEGLGRGGTIGQQMAKSEMTKAQTEYMRAGEDLQKAQGALDDYASQSTNIDTDTLNAYSAKFAAAQQAYNQSKQTLQDAQTLIDQNYPQSRDIQAQTGARSVTVTDVGPTLSDKTQVYNGSTIYLGSDGTYYTAPQGQAGAQQVTKTVSGKTYVKVPGGWNPVSSQ